MSRAGLESFGAYQKARALFDSCYLESISVSTQAEQAGGFSRPYGTWGSHFDPFPGLKAWAIFDCPSGTFQGEMRPVSGLSPIRDCTRIFSPQHSTLDSSLYDRGRSRSLAQPFQGCEHSTPQSQGSSVQAGLAAFATLGFEAESLRDSSGKRVYGFSACTKHEEAPHD
jgi:hypothetical protein